MQSDILVLVTGLLALGALVAGLLAWRAAGSAPLRLQLMLEKMRAGERAEAETTRAALAAAEGRLTAAIQAGTTEALKAAFAQMSAATQSVANTVDALRRQAAEDSQKTLGLLETRLGAIQTSVNEKLHEAVEQQMTNSFARVLEQFAQVQQAMGEVQSAAAQIGDLKRVFSNVKTRRLGEAQLGAMLEQVLPPGAFERNFALRDGARERVDFAIRMPSRGAELGRRCTKCPQRTARAGAPPPVRACALPPHAVLPVHGQPRPHGPGAQPTTG